MKNLDIKNFTTLSGVTIGDYFLMVTKMETDGKLSVESFVTYMRNLAQPQISETTGNWVFTGIDGSTIDTGVKASADTPVFRKQDGAIVWKYTAEDDTQWRTLVEISDLKFDPSDLTQEQWSKIKLNYSDLTEEDKQDLRSVFLGVVNRAEQAAIGYENAKNEIYKSISSAAEANEEALKAQAAAESAQKAAEEQRDQTIDYLDEVKADEAERVKSENERKQQEAARVDAEKKRTDDWQAWFEAETSGVKALWAAWYTNTQNVFNTWFGATENEGVRKSVSDWLAEVQRLWTAFYGADSNSGVRGNWAAWLQSVTNDWSNKLTSVDNDWSSAKEAINSQWAALMKVINDNWAEKQSTIDTEWSDKKTEITNAWNTWFGTDETLGIRGDYKAWYDALVADWDKWYGDTKKGYATWFAKTMNDWNALSGSVNDAIGNANDAAENANNMANHPPYVGDDLYWYVWNNTTKTYDKTDKYSKGDGFSIKKTFASIAEMEAYVNPSTATAGNPILKLGDFVLISSNVEDEDNSKLYVVTSVTSSAITYGFMTDMSGARGFTGHTPQLSVGTITTGAAGTLANVSLTENGTDANGNPKYLINFVIPKGDKGDKGDAFTYEDFTDEQIAGLQKPATDAAAVALSAANNANDKATLANNAAANADEKAELANSAAAKANTAATNANDKAALAKTAANNANQAATKANDAATKANDAATNANDAATNANTAVDNLNWDNLKNKPSTFTPSAHNHAISEITNLQAILNGKAAADHTHTTANISDFTTKVKTLQAADILSAEPTESTTTHTVNGVSVAYQIGELVRVPDSESETGYKFYQLHAITDGKAIWLGTGSGGNIDITETVSISLASNQSSSDSSLVGTSILVEDITNGTETLMKTTWQGSPITIKITAMTLYRVTFGAVEGYQTPESVQYTARLSSTRSITATYNTCVLSVAIRGLENGASAQATVAYGSKSYKVSSGGTVKVPIGTQVSVSVPKVSCHITPSSQTFTPDSTSKSISFAYKASKVKVSILSNQSSDSTISAVKATVAYGSTSVQASNGSVVYIPHDQTVTVTFPAVGGYKTPSAVTINNTSGGQATASGTYHTEIVTVTVSADNGTSMSGRTVTISGTQYTYAGRAISKKIPFGTSYSVSCSAYNGYNTPATQTFTASQTSRAVSMIYETIKLGVYIQDKSGRLWTTDSWNTSNNSNANAIAVLTSNVKVLVALTDSGGTKQIHSSYSGALENYMTAISDTTQAKADYKGAENTANIMRLQSSTSYAAGWCNAFTFPDGKTKGHLPSLGEFWEVYQNKSLVDAALSKCGGTAINTERYHWCSTFWGIYGGYRGCWMLGWSGGYVGDGGLVDGGYVRAFAAYSD